MSLIDGIYWQNVYEADKPKEKTSETNYQRLVRKTPEELATWIETIAGCDLCPMFDEQCSGGGVNSHASCKRHWLEWLRQEAT